MSAKLLATPALARERISIGFAFGSHHSSHDVGNLRRAISSFKPHLLIVEDGFCPESRRLYLSTVFQKFIQSIRNNISENGRIDAVRAWLLKSYSEHPHGNFLVEEIITLAQVPNLLVHVIEGHTERGLGFLANGKQEYSTYHSQFIQYVESGDIERSLFFYEAFIRTFTVSEIAYRNKIVVRNFLKLPDEISELFPHLCNEPHVKVLVYYGAAHRNLAVFVKNEDYECSDCSDRSVPLDSRQNDETELLVRLEHSLDYSIPEFELIAAMRANCRSAGKSITF